MDKFLTVAQVVTPIFVSVFLGICARKKQLLTAEETNGLQQFVMNFGLPCVVFNSCLTADIGAESLTSMAFVTPLMLLSVLWAFRARKSSFPTITFPSFLQRRKRVCWAFRCL